MKSMRSAYVRHLLRALLSRCSLKTAEAFSKQRRRAIVDERKLVHEAAWCWTETHLDHYGKVFRDNMENPRASKTTVWERLVELRKKREDLEEELKVMRLSNKQKSA